MGYERIRRKSRIIGLFSILPHRVANSKAIKTDQVTRGNITLAVHAVFICHRVTTLLSVYKNGDGDLQKKPLLLYRHFFFIYKAIPFSTRLRCKQWLKVVLKNTSSCSLLMRTESVFGTRLLEKKKKKKAKKKTKTTG